ncbi:GNAT family N-acetyltransferase [Pseudoneobacillus sp. C159]
MLKLETIDQVTQYMAKQIIYQGLFERFGNIHESFIPDTHHPYKTFIENGDTFVIGQYEGLYVCTGGLIQESPTCGRIVRISVLKDFRGKGYAKRMIEYLESVALAKKLTEIVLETNEDWDSAIRLYQKMGYTIVEQAGGCFHFVKFLTPATKSI